MPARRHGALIAAMLLCHPAASAEEWKNWFDDPFFQVRAGLHDCPAPLGPVLPKSKRNAEAHYRIERGTSCWLAGRCAKANAYLYDADIGKAAAKAFSDTQDFADSSLWVTVQRRFVFVEGCVSRPEQERQIQALLESLPDVERIIVQVSKPGEAKPPYTPASAALP